MIKNWENTLDQLYKNYMKKCKQINRAKEQLKHMEITIRTFELRFNDETEKLRKKALSL